MRRFSLIFVLTLILALSFGLANAQSLGAIYISNVTGSISADTLGVGQEIAWEMTLHNANSEEMVASNNGFRVFSPDGATWTPIEIDTAGYSAYIDAFGAGNTFLYNAAGNTGSGPNGDTVGIGGFDTRFPCVGFAASFNSPAFVVRIPAPGIDSSSAGKTICIDSGGYNINTIWLWGFCSGAGADLNWGPIASPYGGPVCYTVEGTGTAIDESNTDILPSKFSLSQNYPNPFNPTTEISFDVPTKSHVTLKVYNLLGHEVTTLVDEDVVVGSHKTSWDGRDRSGSEVATGIYFYKMVAGDFVETRKMMLLR